MITVKTERRIDFPDKQTWALEGGFLAKRSR